MRMYHNFSNLNPISIYVKNNLLWGQSAYAHLRGVVDFDIYICLRGGGVDFDIYLSERGGRL